MQTSSTPPKTARCQALPIRKTERMTSDILIYEYQNNFFIIQRSQQGKHPNPLWGTEQRASENVKLFAELSVRSTFEDVGKAVVEALDRFDTILPAYDCWELDKLNRQLCEWIGVKSINSLYKNSRLVQVIRDDKNITVLPFDNHNKNPWYSPMTSDMGFKNMKNSQLPLEASFEIIGNAISVAFNLATYHPKRK